MLYSAAWQLGKHGKEGLQFVFRLGTLASVPCCSDNRMQVYCYLIIHRYPHFLKPSDLRLR